MEQLNAVFTILKPVILVIAAMVIYILIIHRFCGYIGRKDIFPLHLRKHARSNHPLLKKFCGWILYIIEYFMVFPFLILCWISFLVTVIDLLTASQNMELTLLVAVALAATVRILSYLNQPLSTLVAEIVPYSILAMAIFDKVDISITNAFTVPVLSESILITTGYYLALLVFIEILMRILDKPLSKYIMQV